MLSTPVFFRVTRKCNVQCVCCLAPPIENEKPLEDHLNAIRILSFWGIKNIKISGGEPLVYPYIKEIIDLCRELKLNISLCTNGILLDKYLDILNNITVQISLHGFEENHNKIQNKKTFKKIINNIKLLNSNGIIIRINTLFHPKFPIDFEKFINFLLTLGIRNINFMPLTPRGNGINHYYIDGKLYDEINEINLLAEKYRNEIKIRYLDFFNKNYLIYEPDGRLILENNEEGRDEVIYTFNANSTTNLQTEQNCDTTNSIKKSM